MRGLASAIAGSLAAFVAGLVAGCVVAPPATSPRVVGCDLAGRAWQQTSPGPCGASVWRFTPRPDGKWYATESGCTNASGIARYDGSMVTVDFQYPNGGGRYRWPLDGQCRSARGEVSWNAGPVTGQTAASTLAPLGPAPAPRSIQSAIDAAPPEGGVITIAPGTYRERLLITRPNIVLRGESADPRATVIVFDASSGVTGSTFTTATVEVRGRDFRAENLTFFNDYNRTHVQQKQGSQALALLVAGDRAVFRNVRLIGDQDTLYVGSSDCTPPGHEVRACTPTRQYFEDCFIEGNVDFIFGNGIAAFSRCEIRSNQHIIGYITAQGRQGPDEQSLFVFDHCRLTADPGVEHVWLGRPWRPLASVVFLDTEMGAHIEPLGWREWHPGETNYIETVFYAEYGSTGPGAHPAERDPHRRALTAEEAAAYRPARVMAGADAWNPGSAPR